MVRDQWDFFKSQKMGFNFCRILNFKSNGTDTTEDILPQTFPLKDSPELSPADGWPPADGRS